MCILDNGCWTVPSVLFITGIHKLELCSILPISLENKLIIIIIIIIILLFTLIIMQFIHKLEQTKLAIRKEQMISIGS